MDSYTTTSIVGKSIDELVIKGVKHIKENGIRIEARAGSAIQAFSVDYILSNSLNRVHNLRAPDTIRYFARELLAYFKGDLNIHNGLIQASHFWKKLADKNGNINSNYGYYIFHQELPESLSGKNQLEWVIKLLQKNRDSRRAFIKINQLVHKTPTLDFPCTIGLQFFIRNDFLCCEVSSRSTDIVTGLPYDMGFFSLLTELVHIILVESGMKTLCLGYTKMSTTFTQIYDRTASYAEQMLKNGLKNSENNQLMPPIENGQAFLHDIYNQTFTTKTMQWIKTNIDIS
jgi:thymidylate synthase